MSHDIAAGGANAPKFRVGDRVRCVHGVGHIEFVATSSSMDSPLYTVAIDSRMRLRMLERDLERA